MSKINDIEIDTSLKSPNKETLLKADKFIHHGGKDFYEGGFEEVKQHAQKIANGFNLMIAIYALHNNKWYCIDFVNRQGANS